MARCCIITGFRLMYHFAVIVLDFHEFALLVSKAFLCFSAQQFNIAFFTLCDSFADSSAIVR